MAAAPRASAARVTAAAGDAGEAPAPVPVMRQALGPDFEKLHPRLQSQYDLDSRRGLMFRGEGVAEYVRRDPWFIPFLYVGSKRRIMFPETGRDVPVIVRNYAYRDRFGREAITWTRDYAMQRRTRRFDEVMVVTAERGPVMYAGTHHHLAVDMKLSAGPEGELIFRSGAQRLFVRGVRIVFPMVFSGVALGRERFHEAEGRFEVDVEVTNRRWGTIFAYRAWFRGDVQQCEAPPDDVRPLREEARC